MNSIRQTCPTCNRTLELPVHAQGRLAKCPACDTTFTIQTQTTAKSEPFSSPREESSATNSDDPVANPYAAPLSTAKRSTSNPYRSPTDAFEAHGHSIVAPVADEIVSATVAIFVARWVPMVLAAIIVAVGAIVGFVIPAFALPFFAQAGGQAVAAVGMLALVAILAIGSCYAAIGLARVALAVARNEPTPLAKLKAPFHLAIQFFISMFVLYMGVVVVAGGLFAVFFVFAQVGGGGGPITAIAMGLGIMLAVIAAIGAQVVLWPWIFVIADEQATAVDAIGKSVSIAMENKGTSVMMVVASTILSFAGALACSVGHLITTPITLLLFAVAYLAVTGQPVSHPNHE